MIVAAASPGLFSNPVGWGITGGLAGYQAIRKIGHGRRTADDWVPKENEFTDQFLRPLTDLYKSDPGRATSELSSAWTNYQNQGNQWAGGDDTKQKVVRQSVANLGQYLPDWVKGNTGMINPQSQIRTPDWNPNAKASIPTQSPGQLPIPKTPTDLPSGSTGGGRSIPPWLMELLPYLVNAGTNVAATALQARAQNQGNAEIRERTALMDKLAREEQARRDFYAKMLLPNLMRGTGWGKDAIAQQMQQLPYNQTTTAASQGF